MYPQVGITTITSNKYYSNQYITYIHCTFIGFQINQSTPVFHSIHITHIIKYLNIQIDCNHTKSLSHICIMVYNFTMIKSFVREKGYVYLPFL